jgi:hypothetical protein
LGEKWAENTFRYCGGIEWVSKLQMGNLKTCALCR